MLAVAVRFAVRCWSQTDPVKTYFVYSYVADRRAPTTRRRVPRVSRQETALLRTGGRSEVRLVLLPWLYTTALGTFL